MTQGDEQHPGSVGSQEAAPRLLLASLGPLGCLNEGVGCYSCGFVGGGNKPWTKKYDFVGLHHV